MLWTCTFNNGLKFLFYIHRIGFTIQKNRGIVQVYCFGIYTPSYLLAIIKPFSNQHIKSIKISKQNIRSKYKISTKSVYQNIAAFTSYKQVLNSKKIIVASLLMFDRQ